MCSRPSHLLQRHLDSCQCWMSKCGEHIIVKAGQREVLWHVQTECLRRFKAACGYYIASCNNRGWPFLGGTLQQRRCRLIAIFSTKCAILFEVRIDVQTRRTHCC